MTYRRHANLKNPRSTALRVHYGPESQLTYLTAHAHESSANADYAACVLLCSETNLDTFCLERPPR
jgi:hypothetical protein